MVHVHNVPWRASRRSLTSLEVHAAHDLWRGKATTPHRRHSEPISAGASGEPANRPSATGARSTGIGPRGLEADRRRPGDHVAQHPPGIVELGHREEGPDPLAAVV